MERNNLVSIGFLLLGVFFLYYLPIVTTFILFLFFFFMKKHSFAIIFFSISYSLLSFYIDISQYPTADIISYYDFISQQTLNIVSFTKIERTTFMMLHGITSIPIHYYSLYTTFILTFSYLYAMHRMFYLLKLSSNLYWVIAFLFLVSPADLLAYENIAAFSLAILAYTYVYTKNYKTACLILIFSFTFHIASIIAILPIISSYFLKRTKQIIAFYLSIAFCLFVYLNFSLGATGVAIIDLVLGKLYSYFMGPWSNYIRIYEYILLLFNIIKVMIVFITLYYIRRYLDFSLFFFNLMLSLSLIMIMTLPFSSLSFRVMYLYSVFIPFILLLCNVFWVKVGFKKLLSLTILLLMILLPLPRALDYYRFVVPIVLSNTMKLSIFERSIYDSRIIKDTRESSGANREK